MKKTIAMAIIVLAMPQKLAAQTGDKTADTVTISANYALSSIGFSIIDQDSGSILTWRDIHLNGAQINVEFNKAPFVFNKTNIGVGFHKSFHGYHTDDDANHSSPQMFIASTEAIFVDLKYEILLEENKFNPKLGMEFNYLKLENYNAKLFLTDGYHTLDGKYFWNGLVNKYDVFKYFLYGGMQVKIVESKFYINASGQIGFGPYIALADWILRSEFKHPVSFYNISFCFRTGGDLEMGLRLGKFTIFTKALLIYEIGPIGYNTFFFSKDDEISLQSTFLDFFRPAFNIGLKVSF
jgi:hypothetical protein